MEAKQLLEKTTKDLRILEEQFRAELFALRFQSSVGNLENPKRIPQIKKDIARVLTVLSERKNKGEVIHSTINVDMQKTLKKIEAESKQFVKKRKEKLEDEMAKYDQNSQLPKSNFESPWSADLDDKNKLIVDTETKTPVTAKPVVTETKTPVTAKPVVKKPVVTETKTPVTAKPVVKKPVVTETKTPVTAKPVVTETKTPVTAKPVVKKPVVTETKTPVTAKPVVKKPVVTETKTPVTAKPVVKKPVVTEIKTPVTAKPVITKSQVAAKIKTNDKLKKLILEKEKLQAAKKQAAKKPISIQKDTVTVNSITSAKAKIENLTSKQKKDISDYIQQHKKGSNQEKHIVQKVDLGMKKKPTNAKEYTYGSNWKENRNRIEQELKQAVTKPIKDEKKGKKDGKK
ncbi:50S ribosomal protein L29 [Spiroplasma endosymbiont of Amphibalanus improvisus]|uniref:50S ribosomal protein L29 n=1 Tax=Spiroplasma endosymbiont of Amphibalanus improvisus TaxID=3066327 RepID=UPI00313BA5F0